MAYISQDPNQNEEANTTNVLAPTSASTSQQSQPTTSTTSQISTSAPSAGYVSTGNPYGNYGTPSQPQVSAGTSASSRKTTSGPSSGLQTNVQTYAQKNIQSSEKLGEAVAGKLQNTSDIARKNLQSVQQKFGQGVEAGSLENRGTALTEAQKAFTEASTAEAPTRTWNERAATMYQPTDVALVGIPPKDNTNITVPNIPSEMLGLRGNTVSKYQPPGVKEEIAKAQEIAQSPKSTDELESVLQSDRDLIASNKARAIFGDQSFKDYDTQAEAQAAIDEYNKLNPGYYTYGDQQKLSTSEDRLSQILNAKYQGPQELSEIGGYGKAYTGYQDVGELQKQALSGGSKEELLKRTFSTPTGEYSKGSRLLDELLLGQGKAAETLKTTAQTLGATPSGKVGEEFKSTVKEARGQAAQRTQETEQLKQSARQALSTVSEERSGEVNKRIDNVIKDWDKYPQYFRDKFKQELDTHNVASEKNKEYTNIASKYGSEENATERLATIKSTMPNIDTFNYDTALDTINKVSEYDKALEIASQQPNGTGRQRTEWEQRINSAKQYLEKNSGSIESLREQANINNQTLNAISPNFIETYNNLKRGLTGTGRVRDQAEQAFSQMNQNARNAVPKLKDESLSLQQDVPKLQELTQFRNYDPNALSVNLSQLESEALGIQGGEGLYNIIKEQGIEGLLKTKAADRQQLVSQQEQSQLARLQSLAELAKDYGVQGSGINIVNPYGEKDLAGQQTSLSALDIDNFKRQMQGAEKGFRTDAAGSTVSGIGTGTGSSSGWLGTKRASSTKTLSQNFGDLLAQNKATRNMYSDEGVDQDLLKQIINKSQGRETFNVGNVDPGIIGGVTDAVGGISGSLQDLLGASGSAGKNATNLAMLTNPLTASFALANMFGSAIGGSSGEAQGRADFAAQQNALANLQANIQNKINTSGLKNQLTVGQNQARDLELFKLLGLLDTTNL